MRRILVVIFFIFLSPNILFGQLQFKKAYQNNREFVVIDSTIVNFTNFSKSTIIQSIKQAKAYAETLDDTRNSYEKAAIYHFIIHANLTLKKREIALIYLYKLLEIPGLKDSKGAIDVYWGIFNIYRFSGNTPNMIEQFSELRRLGEKYHFYKETEPENLDKIYGEILIRAGYLKEAKKIYLNQLVKDSLLFDPVRAAVIHNDLANIFENLNKPDSATIYRKKSFQLIDSDRKDNYAKGYRSYIRNYLLLQKWWFEDDFSQKNVNFAENFLVDAYTNHKGEYHTAVFANQFICWYYFINKKYEISLYYMNAAIKIATGKLSINRLNYLYNLKTRILDALGNREESDNVFLKFEYIRDSINEKNRNIDLTRYEIKKILKEQDSIKQVAQINENKYKSVLLTTVVIIFFLIVTTLGLFLQYINRKKLKENKNLINQKLEESKTLLKELNHRVKNNLSLIISLIKFQSEEIDETFYLEKFKHLESRITAIAIAHEQFVYSEKNIEGEFYNLEEYLEKICKSLISLSTRKIDYEQNLDIINVSIDTALPIGILMNELISNSIEHAKSENGLKISVQITTKKDWITILYSDSGTEFIVPEESKSLGLFIIEGMVEQLQGSVERKNFQYHIKLKKK